MSTTISPKITEGPEQAIRNLLNRYGTALRNLDLSGAVDCYTSDGVFMAPHNQAAIGTEALREAYTRVFTTARLEVEFDFRETVVVNEEWAFARTTANGKKVFLSVNDCALVVCVILCSCLWWVLWCALGLCVFVSLCQM